METRETEASVPSGVKTVNPRSRSHSQPTDSDPTTAGENNGATKRLRISDAKNRDMKRRKAIH